MKLHSIFLIALTFSNPVYSEAVSESQVDYLSFARGVLVVSLEGTSDELKIGVPQALLAIDGNPGVYGLSPKPGPGDSVISFVYKLPALTTFNKFRIPNVVETPSAYQTFIKNVRVFGSAEGAKQGFELLAETNLRVHEEKNQHTDITPSLTAPVRWVRLELRGGQSIQKEKTFFEFSEIEGYGAQEVVPLDERFSGSWKGRGVRIQLSQNGSLVTGCFDKTGDLLGTVTGNVLQATGIDRHDNTASAFVLSIDDSGSLDGVRSSNGGPFRRYIGDTAAAGVVAGCDDRDPISLGCGSTLYGVNFDYDSANIRAESRQIIEQLYLGLKDDESASIIIEGHTSSEGSVAYNQNLSERRAQAIVQALVVKGVAEGRVSASGQGEASPIASNNDEVGRSLNRRVEVVCRN